VGKTGQKVGNEAEGQAVSDGKVRIFMKTRREVKSRKLNRPPSSAIGRIGGESISSEEREKDEIRRMNRRGPTTNIAEI